MFPLLSKAKSYIQWKDRCIHAKVGRASKESLLVGQTWAVVVERAVF